MTLGRLEAVGQLDAIDLQWLLLIEAEVSNSCVVRKSRRGD